jgi:plastocyanin
LPELHPGSITGCGSFAILIRAARACDFASLPALEVLEAKHRTPLNMKTSTAHTLHHTVTRAIQSFALLVCALLGCSVVDAAEFTVVMTGDYHFNPSYQEIEVNDTVTWVNLDHSNIHSAVSTNVPNGAWDTGDLAYGQSKTIQFYVPETYTYEDYYFGGVGMNGTLVVRPSVQPATLIDPMRLQDGRFQFTLSNLTVGATNVVQGSTNLADWTDLATNVAASAVETWTDNGAAAFGRRFYRCWQSP